MVTGMPTMRAIHAQKPCSGETVPQHWGKEPVTAPNIEGISSNPLLHQLIYSSGPTQTGFSEEWAGVVTGCYILSNMPVIEQHTIFLCIKKEGKNIVSTNPRHISDCKLYLNFREVKIELMIRELMKYGNIYLFLPSTCLNTFIKVATFFLVFIIIYTFW